MSRLLFAVAACLPPLVVYARTMAPGLVGRGDVPKFQYLGVVLGTAHAPGYPLFVQLSWLFSQIPVGTVAWRINLMTMLFGVAAAGATAWVARSCGASRPAALLAAWGLAFGPVFWEQATAAEVYTLATLLHAVVLGLVLRWHRTRRDAHLLQAVAVSALALGHHPTFAMTAPALAVFVLVTEWRVITRPRVLIGSAALVLLGLAQYAFIILRTMQGSLYLEARARNLVDLVGVLRGSQYDSHLFAFTASDLVMSRTPLVWGFITHELTWPGVALALVGFAVLLGRRPAYALLLAMTGAIVFAFAASYDVGDAHVFVIPVFLVMWIAAAVGLGAVASLVPARRAAAVAAGVATVFGAWAVVRAFPSHDLSDDRWDRQYVDALLDQVASPATLLFDDYDPMSHAVRYRLFAERSGHRVRIGYAAETRTPADDFAGARATYAVEASRAILEARGLELSAVELDARLTDRLLALPARAIVALALPAGASRWLAPDDARFLQAVGARRLPDAAAYVAITMGGALVGDASGADARVEHVAGSQTVRVSFTGGDASVSAGAQEWTSDRAGLIVALSPDGEVLWVEELNRLVGARPTFESTRRALFKVTGVAPCRASANAGWAVFEDSGEIGTRLSAWLQLPSPREGRSASVPLVIYAASDGAPVTLAGRSLGDDRALAIETQSFDRANESDAVTLSAIVSRDGAPPFEKGRFVTRATASMAGLEDGPAGISALLLSSERPIGIVAHATADAPVAFCLPPVQGVVVFGDRSESRRELVRGESDAIGRGWHGVEGAGADRLRWTSAARSTVRFSLGEAVDFDVRLDAGPMRVETGDAVELLVNGRPVGRREVVAGQSHYHWSVPAAAVHRGLNEITIALPVPRSPLELGTGTDPRRLGLGVKALVLLRPSR